MHVTIKKRLPINRFKQKTIEHLACAYEREGVGEKEEISGKKKEGPSPLYAPYRTPRRDKTLVVGDFTMLTQEPI